MGSEALQLLEFEELSMTEIPELKIVVSPVQVRVSPFPEVPAKPPLSGRLLWLLDRIPVGAFSAPRPFHVLNLRVVEG